MWSKNKYPSIFAIVGCFFPWIGIFVGLGIFLIGIFKHRSVQYALIGIAGAIFSRLVAFGISYNMMNNEGIQISFQRISRNKLNELVGRLENYKSIKNKYPDSLDQLLETGKYDFKYDPIQVNQQRKSSQYRYTRNGDKYILFSAGQDGLDGTFDDIYPDSISRKNSIAN